MVEQNLKVPIKQRRRLGTTRMLEINHIIKNFQVPVNRLNNGKFEAFLEGMVKASGPSNHHVGGHGC